MRKVTALSFGIAILTGSSLAAQTMAVGEGCEAYATVHRDSCIVSNYVRCGDRTEVYSFYKTRLTDTHVFGPDWDLLKYVADGNTNSVLASPGTAPEASLTQALETGESLGAREYGFATGVLKDNKLDVVSQMRMSDAEVELNGHTLRVGSVTRNMTVRKNGVTAQYDFVTYATPDGRLFIEGSADVEQFGNASRLEWTPRQIAMPGEDGFLSVTSNFGCEG
ncbi:hypothetical protein [Shimia sp.]|uniref:hypothetical protein n=1 Tax=Shimia sp. TaxID=1954381 RepID=UPI003297F629